jgi:hypothetical protein
LARILKEALVALLFCPNKPEKAPQLAALEDQGSSLAMRERKNP